MENKAKCVLIDDDQELAELIKVFFEDNFFVDILYDKNSAIEYFASNKEASIILCDLKLPDGTGLELISAIREAEVNCPLIMVTGEKSKETAIEAIQMGAYDYISKPLDFNELKVVIERAIRFFQLKSENISLQKKLHQSMKFDDLVGKSKKMQELFSLIERVSRTPANVLISGESGSGKEMVARAIHRQGPRKNHSFVAVNCSAIPAELMESELFGHKKGAFTGAIADRKGLFEEANGGSIFLDEIGDMPLELQVKILRVLQEKKIKPVGESREIPIDVRVVAATHRDLREMVQQGEFREDLFFRLNVIPITVPALRERKEDIPLLADIFLKKFKDYNPGVTSFSPEALLKLSRLRWTGNVRELENTIERAISLCSGNEISETDLSIEINSEQEGCISNLFTRLPTLKQLEKEYLQYVLMNNDGKKEKSAEILGIDRKTLYRKIKDYSL